MFKIFLFVNIKFLLVYLQKTFNQKAMALSYTANFWLYVETSELF